MSFRSATRSLSLLSLFLVQGARGVQQYIDDQYGDSVTGVLPWYNPIGGANGWNNTFSACASCDLSQEPFNGTFSASQSSNVGATPRTVAFTFHGVSLQVFGFTSDVNAIKNPGVWNTNLSFLLNDTQVGTFVHVPNNTGNPDSFTDGLNYNVNMYSVNNLPLGNHTFIVQAMGASMVYFDYALYDDGTGSPSTGASGTASGVVSAIGTASNNGGAATGRASTGANGGSTAAGAASSTGTGSPAPNGSSGSSTTLTAAAAGGAAVLVLVAAAIGFLCWRKKRRQARQRPVIMLDDKFAPPPGPGNIELGRTGAPAYGPLANSSTSYFAGKTEFAPGMSPLAYHPSPTSPYAVSPAGEYHSRVPPAGAPFPGGFAMAAGEYGASQGRPQTGVSYSSGGVYTTTSEASSRPQTMMTYSASDGYSLAPPPNAQTNALLAKHAAREQEFARDAREREEALLARAAGRVPMTGGYAPSHSYTAEVDPYAAGGYNLAPPRTADEDALRAKHAEREEEYARAAREREEALLARAASRATAPESRVVEPASAATLSRAATYGQGPAPGAYPSSSAGPASAPGMPDYRAELDAMRAEMSRMQRVQQVVVAELGAVPPPQYSGAA